MKNHRKITKKYLESFHKSLISKKLSSYPKFIELENNIYYSDRNYTTKESHTNENTAQIIDKNNFKKIFLTNDYEPTTHRKKINKSVKKLLLNDIIQKKGNIKPLEKFLCSKGLTRETVAESDKKLILMDYCCSGDSLKGAEALFKRIYQNSENICAENPMNFITDVSLENKLYRILRSCVYKPFSFVNRSVDLSDSPSSFVNVSKANYESRLMWFKLLDNFMLNKKSNIQDVRSDYQIWFL